MTTAQPVGRFRATSRHTATRMAASIGAAALIIISIAMALALSRSTVEILPLAASVVLTLSLFRFDGIKLRLGLLAGSVL